MKTPALIFVLAISYSLAPAQTPEIDSLIQNLQKYSKDDSLRAQLLLDVALKLRRVDPDKAKDYYQKAFETAQVANEELILIKANNGLAICYGTLGNYPEAIQAFRTTIDLSMQYNQPGRAADGYNGLGIVYKRLGDYPQSLEYYSMALPIYDSVNDFRGLGAAHENIGVLYDLMKDRDKSMEHYQKAIAIYKEHNEVLLSSMVLQNVAILFTSEKKYNEALDIFYRNKRLYDSLHRHPNSIENAGNIGYILIKQKKYREAKELLLPYLEKAKQYGLKQEEASITNNVFEIALAENSLDQALTYANEYQRLAKELESKEYLKTSYSLLAQLHERKGDYLKALDAYKQYKAWSDSLFNEENTRAFKAQEVKVEVIEKNKQLAEQNLRLEFLQNLVRQETRMKWLMVVASALLLATVVLFYQKFANRKRVNELLTAKNEEISRQKVHIEEINYQLENRMLRAQINPHFIFNSLSSIQHFITNDDRQSSLKYLSKFSNLLRHILESSITGNVLMKEEIKLLSMYLELESLRFNGDFKYDIQVDDKLDIESIEMPTMILQPLIENAVLHGLMPKSGNRKLELSFKLVDDITEIRIRDNGIGRQASQALQKGKRKANPSRGIGVTEQRLASLREKYGWEIEMSYHDLVDENEDATGTLVVLKMPMMTNPV
jgi:tetratricopeptide (TPR) repeat protein